MIRNKYYRILTFCALILIMSCDEWDDHNQLAREALNENLLEAIGKEPSLTQFAAYLKATGYDQVLASSKTFTVWAPDNSALEGLSSDIANDEEKLKQFIGNHISYQAYFTESAGSSARVKMVNGKNLHWYGTSLEDAALTSSNQYYRNGVLHIISKAVMPKPNTWEVFRSSSLGQKQLAYIQSLTYQLFVDSLATQTGVDPATGQPIYEPGTGLVSQNSYLNNIYDLANEDSLSTFIVLTDEAFDAEFEKVKPYFKTVTNSTDTTTRISSWFVVKDLVLPGALPLDVLPDTVISTTGIKVPVNKSAVVETHVTSNGIVYVMSRVDFRLKDKFPPVIIQGEDPNGFSRSDKDVNIHRRLRDWADGGKDLRVWNHGIAQFNVRYLATNLPAMKYKVYWRTANDFVDTTVVVAPTPSNPAPYQPVNSFVQRLALDLKNRDILVAPAPLKDFGLKKVNTFKANPAKDVPLYLGEYTHTNYRALYLYVIADNASSPQERNPIEIDYIKLVPVF